MRATVYLLIGLLALGALPLSAATLAATESRVSLSLTGVMQQTPSKTYSYIIRVSGAYYQMTNGATGQVIYQSTDATQVINSAIGNTTQGNNVLFSSGTYNLKGSVNVANKNDITIDFEVSAKLYLANGVNAPVMWIQNSRNILVQNPTIDGNGANQVIGGYPPDGIAVYNDCSNVTVDGAIIDNCREYGYAVWDNVTDCGIKNSKVTNCGWNCITLGFFYPTNVPPTSETGLYATNNECAYCSDVGITTFAIGSLIQGNYIHDMYGTTGYANSQWGIGVEGGHGHTIKENKLVGCPRGMSIEQTDGIGSNTIMYNNITDCGFGIVLVSPNNTVSHNIISNFDRLGWGQQAIAVNGDYGGADSNEISQNMISATAERTAHAVFIGSADNTQFVNNTINVPRLGTSWFSIQLSGSSYTMISSNVIVGFRGIYIGDAACQYNTISYNDLTHCNAETGAIADYGTGTIIYGNIL